jgi:hypothetical protein
MTDLEKFELVYHNILPDMKLAAIKLYERNPLYLDDFLNCCGLSERTVWHVCKLYSKTVTLRLPHAQPERKLETGPLPR